MDNIDEFSIVGNVIGHVTARTPTSYRFQVEARDRKTPSVSSDVGSIDVHYPVDGDIALVATVILDVMSL